MTFGLLQSLRILALDAVLRPDGEAFYRHVCRWYSRNFNTALDAVENLPVTEVYTHYYEGHYEDLETEDLVRLATEVTETPETRALRETEDAKKLGSEAASVTASLERLKKSFESGALVRAVDTFGRLRGRPNAKTVSDLKSVQEAEDGLGTAVGQLLASSAPAPAPKSPEDLPGLRPQDFEFTLGGDIPEDFDALGQSKVKKPLKI